MREGARARQLETQEAALSTLLRERGTYKLGPWMPSGEIVAATQMLTDCSHQAATGALRSLLAVGLVQYCLTREGSFWRPSDAAEQIDLLWPAPPTKKKGR